MCPIKVFSFKDRKPPWYNVELLKMAVNRDEFYASGKNAKDENLIELAREYRNRLKTGIKNVKSEYYITQINNHKLDPLKFWAKVKELIPDSVQSTIGGVRMSPSEELCLPKDSPDIINSYFATIGTKLASHPSSEQSVYFETTN